MSIFTTCIVYFCLGYCGTVIGNWLGTRLALKEFEKEQENKVNHLEIVVSPVEENKNQIVSSCDPENTETWNYSFARLMMMENND